LRLAVLALISTAFFAAIGPVVGAIIFFPTFGPLSALLVAHSFGLIPAALTGFLNALVIATGLIQAGSAASRSLYAFVGALCGLIVTVLVLDYPDWYLMQQTFGWYDFWYTFKRSYAQLAAAGLVAGAVCSFIFNTLAQKIWQPNSAFESGRAQELRAPAQRER
jgi:hypothetical protein